MIKQCSAIALAATILLTGSAAWATREQHTFEVSLEVPTRSFYILPSDPGWIHQTQELMWDYPTSSLSPVRKYFDVRHESSAIQARLEENAYVSNGKPDDNINLRVRFNGVTLGLDPKDVVSQADAAAGVRVLLEIVPLKPWWGHRPGDYSGNVLLLFSAKAPG